VVLVNSNPATIMTDPEFADATYVEPIVPEIVAKIIAKETALFPGGWALLPTMGGQTALNCALALDADGTLEKYGVEMIGAKADAIDKAENRQRFREAMDKIGLESARSGTAHSVDEALAVIEHTGLPAIIRPSGGGQPQLDARPRIHPVQRAFGSGSTEAAPPGAAAGLRLRHAGQHP
jgi:carbamoyl-phosphate synthase large subunit